MKALMLKAVRTLALEEVPVAPVGPRGVKIRVRRVGFCGTDHSTFTGAYPVPGKYPLFIGHEIAGVVEEVGKSVTDVAPGQLVVTNPVSYCGDCYRCRNGQQHYCEKLYDLWKPNGGFSEYVVADRQQVFTIPAGITPDQAAFTEPVSVCVHCMDMAEMRPGMSVGILGGGPMGLILLQLAIRGGAAFTLLSEPVESKRKLAKKLGADVVVDPSKDDLIMKTLEATSFRGFDLVIEASGNAKAAGQAFEIAGQKAVIFYFAVYPTDFTVPMSPFTMYLKELTVKGVFFSPYAFPRAINMLPRLELDSLISHRFPLAEAYKAFEAHERGDTVKIMIEC